MRLPMPNKCNEGSCYISRNQTPVTHKVPSISLSIYLSLHLATYLSSYLSTYLPTYLIDVTVGCIPLHISPSRYIAPPYTCWRLTSTGGFVVYLTKPDPGQTKCLPVSSFVSYNRNHRCICRRPTRTTRVRAIGHETRPRSDIKF